MTYQEVLARDWNIFGLWACGVLLLLGFLWGACALVKWFDR